MAQGYDKLYIDLIPKLADCDLAENGRRLGFDVDEEGNVSASFLGRKFNITSAGVDVADGEEVDSNFRSVLVHYITSEGHGQPAWEFLPLFRLTGMIEGQNSQSQGMMTDPMLIEFGGDYEKFEQAARKLSGKYDGKTKDGGLCWIFEPLPKIPVKIVFYEADDEFPADIQILFDKHSPRFMEFECLAFLCGCLISALIHALD